MSCPLEQCPRCGGGGGYQVSFADINPCVRNLLKAALLPGRITPPSEVGAFSSKQTSDLGSVQSTDVTAGMIVSSLSPSLSRAPGGIICWEACGWLCEMRVALLCAAEDTHLITSHGTLPVMLCLSLIFVSH